MSTISVQKPELPVFVFESAAFTAFNEGGLEKYDARYVVAPYSRFIFRPERPAAIIMSGANECGHVRELEISDEGNGLFRVIERVDEALAQTELLVKVDEALVKWHAILIGGDWVEVPRQTWHPIGKAGLDATGTARMLIGLLLALNNRNVVLLNGQRPTRQQWRTAERSGKAVRREYHVRIPGDIMRHAHAVANGKMATRRVAHLVRAHIRRLHDGRVTKVRAHPRGVGRAEMAPVYDATRVGGAA